MSGNRSVDVYGDPLGTDIVKCNIFQLPVGQQSFVPTVLHAPPEPHYSFSCDSTIPPQTFNVPVSLVHNLSLQPPPPLYLSGVQPILGTQTFTPCASSLCVPKIMKAFNFQRSATNIAESTATGSVDAIISGNPISHLDPSSSEVDRCMKDFEQRLRMHGVDVKPTTKSILGKDGTFGQATGEISDISYVQKVEKTSEIESSGTQENNQASSSSLNISSAVFVPRNKTELTGTSISSRPKAAVSRLPKNMSRRSTIDTRLGQVTAVVAPFESVDECDYNKPGYFMNVGQASDSIPANWNSSTNRPYSFKSQQTTPVAKGVPPHFKRTSTSESITNVNAMRCAQQYTCNYSPTEDLSAQTDWLCKCCNSGPTQDVATNTEDLASHGLARYLKVLTTASSLVAKPEAGDSSFQTSGLSAVLGPQGSGEEFNVNRPSQWALFLADNAAQIEQIKMAFIQEYPHLAIDAAVATLHAAAVQQLWLIVQQQLVQQQQQLLYRNLQEQQLMLQYRLSLQQQEVSEGHILGVQEIIELTDLIGSAGGAVKKTEYSMDSDSSAVPGYQPHSISQSINNSAVLYAANDTVQLNNTAVDCGLAASVSSWNTESVRDEESNKKRDDSSKDTTMQGVIVVNNSNISLGRPLGRGRGLLASRTCRSEQVVGASASNLNYLITGSLSSKFLADNGTQSSCKHSESTAGDMPHNSYKSESIVQLPSKSFQVMGLCKERGATDDGLQSTVMLNSLKKAALLERFHNIKQLQYTEQQHRDESQYTQLPRIGHAAQKSLSRNADDFNVAHNISHSYSY